MFVDPLYETCFMSHFRRLGVRGDASSVTKLCVPLVLCAWNNMIRCDRRFAEMQASMSAGLKIYASGWVKKK
jgi:hypothetical protein